MYNFKYPLGHELIAFFEAECIEEDEFIYAYEVTDADGWTLRFSFHAIEGSVQTLLKMGGRTVCTVCSESATQMRIENHRKPEVLYCEFDDKLLKQLKLSVRPRISVTWTSLRA